MTENEIIKGWSFKETIKATENLMEVESKMFKWDVLRHLRDFAKKFKDELEQYRAIGTVEDFKALKEKSEPKKVSMSDSIIFKCPQCGSADIFDYCGRCGCKIDYS